MKGLIYVFKIAFLWIGLLLHIVDRNRIELEYASVLKERMSDRKTDNH